MDSQEYLNQISQSARPAAKPKANFMNSPFFKVGAIGVIAFIVIAIFGSIITGGRADFKTQAIALKVQLDDTLEMISEYQQYVKSSDLRSSSASLYGVLSTTNTDLTTLLEETYEFTSRSIDEKTKEQAQLEKDALNEELFSAKINGILDRVYAHKMAYQISIISTNETSLYKATENEALRSILDISYTSLDNLYSKFNDFSEAK